MISNEAFYMLQEGIGSVCTRCWVRNTDLHHSWCNTWRLGEWVEKRDAVSMNISLRNRHDMSWAVCCGRTTASAPCVGSCLVLIINPRRDAEKALAVIRQVEPGKTTAPELLKIVKSSGLPAAGYWKCEPDLDSSVSHPPSYRVSCARHSSASNHATRTLLCLFFRVAKLRLG